MAQILDLELEVPSCLQLNYEIACSYSPFDSCEILDELDNGALSFAEDDYDYDDIKSLDNETILADNGFIRPVRIADNTYTALTKNNEKVNIFIESSNILENEYKILNTINNNNMANNFIKYFTHNSTNYLVKSLIGNSLENHIKNTLNLVTLKKITLNEYKIHINSLFKQMIYYINSLHELNIVSNDINIKNVRVHGFIIENSKYTNNGVIFLDNFAKSEILTTKKKCFVSDIKSLGFVLFYIQFGYTLTDYNIDESDIKRICKTHQCPKIVES